MVLKSRLPNGQVWGPELEFAPDLAVEVLSKHDAYWNVDEKIQEYLLAGTAAVWLARPALRRIVVFLPDGTETSYGPNDELTGAPVLPALRFRVGDVFQMP